MRIETHPDTTGYAPKHEAWSAIDADTYDGAPDAGRRARMVGTGATPEEAIADLRDQIADYEEERAEQRQADRTRFVHDEVVSIVHLDSGTWAWAVHHINDHSQDTEGEAPTLAGAMAAIASATGQD